MDFQLVFDSQDFLNTVDTAVTNHLKFPLCVNLSSSCAVLI